MRKTITAIHKSRKGKSQLPLLQGRPETEISKVVTMTKATKKIMVNRSTMAKMPSATVTFVEVKPINIIIGRFRILFQTGK